MTEQVQSLIAKYRNRGVIIDTNILVLSVVGAVSRDRVGTFKRTRAYTPEDVDLLDRLLSQFTRVLTTPNIMSEVSNLLRQLHDHDAQRAHILLRDRISVYTEKYLVTFDVTREQSYTRLGVTDSGIIRLALDEGMIVITDDVALQNAVRSAGGDCVNINHLRNIA